MRRSRRLTNSERWELGLFLTMIMVGLLCLTVLVKWKGAEIPRIFAVGSATDTASQLPTSANSSGNLERVPMLEFGDPTHNPSTAALASRVLPETTLRAAVTSDIAPKAKLAKPAEPEIKIYAGKQYRYVKTIKLRVTAYAPDPRCTYPYNGTTTASGLSVKTNGGRLVAADTTVIPMYSLVTVPGYAGGAAVPVLDRGGAIKGNRLDVMLPTFEKAKDWGSRVIDVKIYRPVN